ncbi:hypothetical protein AAVH_38166 [Aphelenchoides avenae]|nr:hypothetical protein AAVH_38166 [Aphelenchus avenae]
MPKEWMCVTFEICGMLASLLILGLSFKKHRESFNIGPRIFAANLMLANVALSVVSFFRDYGQVNEEFMLFYYSLREFVSWRFALQSLMLLIFNCSFVPMMVVTLISLYSSHVLSTGKSVTLFASAVLAAGKMLGRFVYPLPRLCVDILPAAFQTVNVLVIIPPGVPKSMLTTAYIGTCFAFYTVQLVLTGIALTVIRKKNQHQHFSERAQEEAKAKLVRTMMFAIGPCVIQVPFACLMLVRLVRNDSSIWKDISGPLNDIVYIVFALKPTIDAFSILLFMGEYRHYTMSFAKAVKKLAVKLWNAKTFKTKVHHLPSANTITVAPSARTHVHTIA